MRQVRNSNVIWRIMKNLQHDDRVSQWVRWSFLDSKYYVDAGERDSSNSLYYQLPVLYRTVFVSEFLEILLFSEPVKNTVVGLRPYMIEPNVIILKHGIKKNIIIFSFLTQTNNSCGAWVNESNQSISTIHDVHSIWFIRFNFDSFSIQHVFLGRLFWKINDPASRAPVVPRTIRRLYLCYVPIGGTLVRTVLYDTRTYKLHKPHLFFYF